MIKGRLVSYPCRARYVTFYCLICTLYYITPILMVYYRSRATVNTSCTVYLSIHRDNTICVYLSRIRAKDQDLKPCVYNFQVWIAKRTIENQPEDPDTEVTQTTITCTNNNAKKFWPVMETSFTQYTRISLRKDRLQSTMTMKFSRTVMGRRWDHRKRTTKYKIEKFKSEELNSYTNNKCTWHYDYPAPSPASLCDSINVLEDGTWRQTDSINIIYPAT